MRIEIRLKSFAQLSEMPNQDGKIVLKIKRDDFDLARQAVEKLQNNLTEKRDSLPPVQTPVSRLFDESEDETARLDENN